MKASGRTAQKGRRWLLQTLKSLWELLLVVAASQKSNLRRLRAAEAKCNELQHRWGPRAAAEDGRVRWTPRSAHLSSQEETSGRRLRRTGAEHRAYTAHNLRKKRSGRGTSAEARNRDRFGAARPTRVVFGGERAEKQQAARSAVVLEARRQGSLSSREHPGTAAGRKVG